MSACDLMRTNFVWVEGPADRAYWRRWLELVSELREGTHYVAMPYGGSLAHCLRMGSGTDQLDPEPGFVSGVDPAAVDLLRLGRHCCVIADSDKASAEDPMGPLARALVDAAEAEGAGDLVLVADWARTVENLIPGPILESA